MARVKRSYTVEQIEARHRNVFKVYTETLARIKAENKYMPMSKIYEEVGEITFYDPKRAAVIISEQLKKHDKHD